QLKRLLFTENMIIGMLAIGEGIQGGSVCLKVGGRGKGKGKKEKGGERDGRTEGTRGRRGKGMNVEERKKREEEKGRKKGRRRGREKGKEGEGRREKKEKEEGGGEKEERRRGEDKGKGEGDSTEGVG
uniref:hypothetical protein n=1 Tax=Bacillus sp. S1-R2T1-FB TaxID=1973493 RepID=UPI001C4E7785